MMSNPLPSSAFFEKKEISQNSGIHMTTVYLLGDGFNAICF